MQTIIIAPGQNIELVAKQDATPAKAIREAIEFCRQNQTSQCDLHYKGFLFGIEPDSDPRQLTFEYFAWFFKQNPIK